MRQFLNPGLTHAECSAHKDEPTRIGQKWTSSSTKKEEEKEEKHLNVKNTKKLN